MIHSASEALHALIVDDDFDSTLMLTTLLEFHGVRVTSAHCAAEALQQLSQAPHIVISDLVMPQTDGYWLMRQIRQLPAHQGGTVPAIALSASMMHAEDAIKSGFQAFLSKPIDFDRLLVTVSDLTGWRSLSESPEIIVA